MQPQLTRGPREPQLIQTLGWWTRPIGYMERCRARFGKRFTLRLLGSPPFAVISSPRDVRDMFQAPAEVLHPGEGARILEPMLGKHSVMLLDEAAHLEQRKLLRPAFHGRGMAALADLMAEVTEREIETWPRDETVVLHPRLQALTLEVILRAVFGAEEGELLDVLRTRLTRILAFGERPSSVITFVQRDLGPLTAFHSFAAMLRQVDERRRNGGEGRDDMMEMLMAARHKDGSPMTPQEVRDELMTLVVAAHETTASELAWAFERLAREPRVLSRLTAEIDSGDGDEYLTATVQETLRRRPVLPHPQPRLSKCPVEIGGWLYPEGVSFMASTYLLHHDPDVYPDPYAFRPERFLEESPGTYTWIPFGGGRRRCIGLEFAMLEMKTVLRAVLERMEVRPAGERFELARRRSVSISPGRGAPTVLRERRQPAAGTAGPSATSLPARM